MKTQSTTENLSPLGTMCINTVCTQASSCLRYYCAQKQPVNVASYSVLNPNHLATLKEDTCPYFLPKKKVIFAKGFSLWLESLSKKDFRTASNVLKGQYNYRTYYRMRKGERLITPHEQAIMKEIIQESGISQPLKFDTYHEDYLWQSNL